MISYRTSATAKDLASLPIILSGLTDSYPDFDLWLRDRAIPSLSCGEGKIVIAEQKDEIVAVALGKKTPSERKIRCVRVLPRFQGVGVGTTIMEKMMVLLDDDKPLITCAHDFIHSYARIWVNHFRYDLTHVEKDMYVKGRLEYIFNGNAG